MSSRMVQLKAGGHISQSEEEIVDMEIKTMQVATHLTTLAYTTFRLLFDSQFFHSDQNHSQKQLMTKPKHQKHLLTKTCVIF